MTRSISMWLMIVSVAVADDFPPPTNSEPLSEQTWLSARDAADRMRLPSGFVALPFAAEPDVQNPIAMAWDGRGRLWIAENYTYADRLQRFDLSLRDRVVVFDGTHQDRFRTRTVFSDKLQMLTGIEVGHGGVWLMCPPRLLFVPDADGDLIADREGSVVLDGFTVAKQNYHNFANGLRFGPDGWLYGRCGGSCPGRIGTPGTAEEDRLALEGGIWRYHPGSRRVEVLTTGTTNPWGHDWNAVGEGFFVNTVNGHLWQLIHGAHFTRPFTLDPNHRTYELIDFHADHWHFDTGKSWVASRDGKANDYGGGHAHCGAMVYQGTRWPEQYHGKLLTLNMHGRRANVERLDRIGGGYVGKHQPDFLIAADPWFRGMDLSAGPDGDVFLIDWSDTGECHESTGVHRTSGRIFKICYRPSAAAQQNGASIEIHKAANQQLAAMATSPSAWAFRQAKLELARRRSAGDDLSGINAPLRACLADRNASSRQQVQSLLTLHLTANTDQAWLVQQFRHADPHVQAWAIRLATETLPLDDALGPLSVSEPQRLEIEATAAQLLPELAALAEAESSGLVRLTLASTLQRLPVSMRPQLAAALVGHSQDAQDHNIPLMLWYGLMAVDDAQLDDLVDVARVCRIPTTLRLISRRLASAIERAPAALNELITVAAESDDDAFRGAVLAGIGEGWSGWRNAPRPQAWDRFAQTFESDPLQTRVRALEVLFGDGQSLQHVTAIALGQTAATYPIRLAALQTLIQVQADNLRPVCQQLLKDARMNVAAARGLAQFDDPEVARNLVARYRSFRAPSRPQVMSILVSRRSFAKEMLQGIADGKIARDDLSVFQVRQLQAFEDAELNQSLAEVWGELRPASEDKRRTIDALKAQLGLASAVQPNLGNGRALFVKHCQGCHRLYGDGELVGPDLTGGDRGNLDFLLQNIVDPSAVVDKDFRMTRLLMNDGRLLTGLVTSETNRTLVIRTATESLTVDKDAIEARKVTDKSPMPDGLLDLLSADQINDLVGYLRHPTQVALPAR